MAGLGLSFKHLWLDLDCKTWQFAQLWCGVSFLNIKFSIPGSQPHYTFLTKSRSMPHTMNKHLVTGIQVTAASLIYILLSGKKVFKLLVMMTPFNNLFDFSRWPNPLSKAYLQMIKRFLFSVFWRRKCLLPVTEDDRFSPLLNHVHLLFWWHNNQELFGILVCFHMSIKSSLQDFINLFKWF